MIRLLKLIVVIILLIGLQGSVLRDIVWLPNLTAIFVMTVIQMSAPQISLPIAFIVGLVSDASTGQLLGSGSAGFICAALLNLILLPLMIVELARNRFIIGFLAFLTYEMVRWLLQLPLDRTTVFADFLPILLVRAVFAAAILTIMPRRLIPSYLR